MKIDRQQLGDSFGAMLDKLSQQGASINDSQRDQFNDLVAIYVVSKGGLKKHHKVRLKNPNWEHLSEQKTSKYANENRLVFEFKTSEPKGNKLRASPILMEELNRLQTEIGGPLKIERHKTSQNQQAAASLSSTTVDATDVDLEEREEEFQLEALSQEEYEALVNISKLFNEYLTHLLDDKEEIIKHEKKESSQSSARHTRTIETKVIFKELQIYENLLRKLENIPDQIKQRFLKRMGELQRKIAELNKEHSEQVATKRSIDRESKEDARQVTEATIKENVKAEEIETYHQKLDNTQKATKRT